jgi:hypothetical protein
MVLVVVLQVSGGVCSIKLVTFSFPVSAAGSRMFRQATEPQNGCEDGPHSLIAEYSSPRSPPYTYYRGPESSKGWISSPCSQRRAALAQHLNPVRTSPRRHSRGKTFRNIRVNPKIYHNQHPIGIKSPSSKHAGIFLRMPPSA